MHRGKSDQHPMQRDWRSKWIDGVMVALILCLTWLIIALSIRPLAQQFGRPGLLVYILGLMAIAMYSFQQGLAARRSDMTRAWYGMCGGFFAWAVVLVSTHLGLPVSHPAGLILIMMVSMVVGILWRSVLPLGARFFSLTLLLNWTGYFVMNAEEMLSAYSPFFTLIYRATGYLSILLAILTLGWILFLTRRRIQRISGALGVWFLVSLAMYVFSERLF